MRTNILKHHAGKATEGHLTNDSTLTTKGPLAPHRPTFSNVHAGKSSFDDTLENCPVGLTPMFDQERSFFGPWHAGRGTEQSTKECNYNFEGCVGKQYSNGRCTEDHVIHVHAGLTSTKLQDPTVRVAFPTALFYDIPRPPRQTTDANSGVPAAGKRVDELYKIPRRRMLGADPTTIPGNDNQTTFQRILPKAGPAAASGDEFCSSYQASIGRQA